MAATKEHFFKGTDPSANADAPVHPAYTIMAAEVHQREAKTARLRALRLERDANAEPETAETKPKRKPAVRRSRPR